MNYRRLLFQRSLKLQPDIIIGMPFYAVQLGKTPGVYKTWSECQEQTTGFRGARFKKFDTEAEAWDFVNGATGGKKVGEKSTPAATSTTGMQKKGAKEKDEKDSSDSEGDSNKANANKAAKDAKKRKVSKDNAVDGDSDQESKKSKTEDDEIDPDAVVVFTDGCCFNSGKGNPHGGVGVYWGPDHPNNLSERLEGRQTNNKAEIYAAIKAVEQAKSLGVKKLVIKTDCSYLVNCQTNWVIKWKKNGWKTSEGEDVTNRSELEELDAAEKDISVQYIHVPGHKGVEGNEEANKLAKAGAKK